MSKPIITQSYSPALGSAVEETIQPIIERWVELAEKGPYGLLLDETLTEWARMHKERPRSPFAVTPKLALVWTIVHLVSDGQHELAGKILKIAYGKENDWGPSGFGVRIRKTANGTPIYAVGFFETAHACSIRGCLLADRAVPDAGDLTLAPDMWGDQ